MQNEVIIDPNNDWAACLLDGNIVDGWKWSSGAVGEASFNQLGGINFYGWEGPPLSQVFHPWHG